MAQVLPNFYGAFTGGRKDAIDFQNMITAQRQAALMNPLEVQGKQINNRYVGGMADNIELGNAETRATQPQKIGAVNSEYGVQTAANQNLNKYYGVAEQGAQRLSPENQVGYRASVADPAGVGNNFRNPPATWTPPNYGVTGNESEMDAWARANGYTKTAPTGHVTGNAEGGVSYNPPAATRGLNVDMSSSYMDQGPADMYNIPGAQDQQNNVGNSNAQTAPLKDNLYGTMDPNVLGPQIPRQTPEEAIAKITAAGLDPTLAQLSVDIDQRRGLPIGMTAAIAMRESNFNLNAVSPKGAQGLMQIMPGNFDMYGGPNFDPANGRASLFAAEKLLAERLRNHPNRTPEELLRTYNGRSDMDYSSPKIDPAAKAENEAYPQHVRDAYIKLFGFAGF